MDDSYDSWRQTSFTELEKEMRARSSARTRTVLGAAALLAAIFAPNSCSSYDACRINDAMRTAGTMGGIAAVMSGIKKYADARVHADALKELTQSFQAEVAPQVVEVEGHTLRLTGTAEDQYREWRKLLKQLYLEETGAAAASTPDAGSCSCLFHYNGDQQRQASVQLIRDKPESGRHQAVRPLRAHRETRRRRVRRGVARP